ncbi:Microtubule-nucleating Tub4p (gamma-tubulin) complex component [Malassezia sp. CBS 17886]|nr:Microtubule-nucleating Tub4p (gamma-tubulin) complex component [Malassezia sp. CBS 17886]
MDVVCLRDLQADKHVSRAVLLDRLREQQGATHIPEPALLRDVVYLLQGISGTHVRVEYEWQRAQHDGPAGTSEPQQVMRLVFDESTGVIAPPTKDRIHRLAELGQLYMRVKAFVETNQQPTEVRLTTQSLCHFLAQELTQYYALVAQIEADATADAGPDAPPQLTLHRLLQLTRAPLLRMRLMSTIVESCRTVHGGALVSTIHTYTLTGDPFIRQFTSTLLDQVSRPFFHCLSRWIYDGELNDPYGEFFVARRAEESNEHGEEGPDAADVWHHMFVLKSGLLPSFLSEHFARKIFSTGKSLNFIRSSCGDSGWGAMHASLHASGRALRYSDMIGLEHTIDTVFAIASGHLRDLFLRTFRLREHLRAIKEYLLLTKGDFADALMQTLRTSLGRPAHTLYQHNLSAALETAIRASNAQYDDADVLRRLDARSLAFGAGDTGWDTFTLEYRVESPVSAVLDASAMAGYQILFHYLWKIKRVEVTVHDTWTELMKTNQTLLRTRQRAALAPALVAQTRTTLGRLVEMVHFVHQLQGFCELEVIAYSWQKLEQDLGPDDGDLDQLIEAHRAYLQTLINKALLRGGRRGQSDQLADTVRAQLDGVLAFCTAVGELARHLAAELARIASGTQPLASAARTHAHLTDRLDTEHAQFQERMHTMIAVLERHPNLSVRDLARRWNFNVYYRRERAGDRTGVLSSPSRARDAGDLLSSPVRRAVLPRADSHRPRDAGQAASATGPEG